jgi:signal transduction histidine kinase
LFFLLRINVQVDVQSDGRLLVLVSDMAYAAGSFLSKVGTLWLDADVWSAESVRPWGVLRTTTFAILTSISYYISTKIGFALTPAQSPISAFWPTNAVLLASLLLTPRAAWKFFLLAVLPAHLLVQLQTGVPLLTSLGWFVGNVGEAIIGASLIRRFSKPEQLFESLRGVIIFLIFGAMVAPLATSFVDAAVVLVTGRGDAYWGLWTARLFSNVLAELTLVPTIVVVGLKGISWIQKARTTKCLEAALLAIGVTWVSVLVFGAEDASRRPALIYLPLTFLLWATLRFGSGGLAASLSAIAVISMWHAGHGHGPFISASIRQNVISLQILLGTIAVPLILLSATIVERRLAAESLRRSRNRLIDSQEQERHRVARELHDDIGQQLTLVGLELDQIRDNESSLILKPRLDRLYDRVSEVSTATREIARGLHPSRLDHLGLGPALRSLCQEVSREKSLRVNFGECRLPPRLPPQISLCIYRVAQEALQNVVRHARAKRAVIELMASSRELKLRIDDNGIGFNPECNGTDGLGLTSMRERVASIGGTIRITSAPKQGTTIEASVPLPKNN